TTDAVPPFPPSLRRGDVLRGPVLPNGPAGTSPPRVAAGGVRRPRREGAGLRGLRSPRGSPGLGPLPPPGRVRGRGRGGGGPPAGSDGAPSPRDRAGPRRRHDPRAARGLGRRRVARACPLHLRLARPRRHLCPSEGVSDMISRRCKGDIVMARTVVDLNEKLLRKAMRLSGEKRKVALVNWGLEVLVEHLQEREMLKSRGKVIWEGNLDEMRGRVRR